jgi:hypothetical protein
VKRNWLRLTPAMAVAALLGVLCDRPAQATAGEKCDVQLTVELTPDVPDARDDGFLSSLLNNHTAYQLQLLREDDASVIELDLRGPGPDYRCENVIDTIRRDGRVLSIRVDSTTALPTAGGSGPLSSGEASPAQPPELGLGAVYWAVHHPRQAWRILLPMQSSDAAADET